jgi:hypothetical protein
MRRIQILTTAIAAAAVALSPAGEPAHAQPLCEIQGTARMPKDLTIFDAEQGEQPIARFSGGDSALTVTDFPTTGTGRARIETGTGNGSFRIKGWIDVAQIPIFTDQRVPVRPNHVWIGKHQRVEVLAGTGTGLTVKKAVTAAIRQTFTARAACAFFTLQERTPPTWSVPGSARGYVLKKEQLELYDDGSSGANLVTTVHRAPAGNGVLFWSTERKGSWVRVEYHGEVVIDAWARASDLSALPPGETMDQLRPSVTKRSPPRLALAEQPRVVMTTQEVTLRGAAGESAPVIGKIEATTETYVLDIVAGWASVLPKSLAVMPHGDGQFWAKARDLGLSET